MSLQEATGKHANHDMLAAYRPTWILGLAMMHPQSSDPDRLSQAIPHVTARYAGTLGPMSLDRNVDLAASSFDVWSIRDGEWVLVGVVEQEPAPPKNAYYSCVGSLYNTRLSILSNICIIPPLLSMVTSNRRSFPSAMVARRSFSNTISVYNSLPSLG